jgi:hypothetical protein
MMKSSMFSFCCPLLLVVVAVLGMGGGVYVYEHNKTETLSPADTDNRPITSTSSDGTVLKTYSSPPDSLYGFSIDYPIGTQIDDGVAGSVVFQPRTTRGDLTVGLVQPSADCLDTSSGVNPSHKTINGIDFIVYDLDRVLSGSYISVAAREYCAVQNGMEYKIIPKLPYIELPGGGVPPGGGVDQDDVLNQMIGSFKFNNASTS